MYEVAIQLLNILLQVQHLHPFSVNNVGHWKPKSSHKSHRFHKAMQMHSTLSHARVLPHRPYESSPHFLCGQSSTTSSQPHQIHTSIICVFSCPALCMIAPVLSASLTDMTLLFDRLVSPGSSWWRLKVIPDTRDTPAWVLKRKGWTAEYVIGHGCSRYQCQGCGSQINTTDRTLPDNAAAA